MVGTDDLIITEAAEVDAAIITRLLLTAFEEYRGVLDPPSGAHDETEDKVREKMKTAHVVMARCSEVPAGCVFYEPDEDGLYLSRLAVLPEYRRHGIGRALIEYVESRARDLGLQRVRLAVRLALPQLRALYERLGYQPYALGTHPDYHEPTYVILEKQL